MAEKPGLFTSTKNYESKQWGRRVLAVGLLAGTALFASEAISNADTYVVAPGAGDGNGDMMTQVLRDNGTIKPGDRVVVAQSPAEIGPVVGSMPMNQSVDIERQSIKDQLAANRGNGPEHVVSFSEGTAAADLAHQDVGNLPNVTWNNHGETYGATSLTQSWEAQMGRPLTDQLGIPNKDQISVQPGTTVQVSGMDVWGATADGNLGSMINDGLNIQNHRIIAPNEVPVQDFMVNGSEYKIYDSTIPEPEGAVDVPLTAVDANAAPTAPAPAPAEAPAPAPAQSAPEFVGEQPCYDQNGNPYFTPGNAPCDAPAAPNAAPAPAPVVEAPAPAPAEAPAPAQSAPEFFGEQPCVDQSGNPYFTPGDAPC